MGLLVGIGYGALAIVTLGVAITAWRLWGAWRGRMSDQAVEQAAAVEAAEAAPIAPAANAAQLPRWVLPALTFSALGVFLVAMVMSYWLKDDGKLFGQLALISANAALAPSFLYFFGSSHGQQALARMLGGKGDGQ